VTCAFAPCVEITRCPLVGGCIHKGRRLAPPDKRPSTVAYNPMTGTRLDLVVTDEDPGVAEARWEARRAAYLKAIAT
jgi:hypothetical protein